MTPPSHRVAYALGDNSERAATTSSKDTRACVPTTVDPEITTQFLRVRRICVESFGNDAASVATELIDEARLAAPGNEGDWGRAAVHYARKQRREVQGSERRRGRQGCKAAPARLRQA